VKVKVNFCIAYCYETIIFQYAIVTDRAGVQPIGCRLGPRTRSQACGYQLCPALICRLMVATL